MDLESAVDRMLHDMPDDFLLKPYLRANQAEVKSMLLTEYDEERQRMLDRKEGLEEGIEIGKNIGQREGILIGAIETMRELGLNENELIERIISKYGISRAEAALLTTPALEDENENDIQ